MLGAGVQQQEPAGPVRALGLAGSEAGLPEQRRLLVAERGRDGHPGQHRRTPCRTPRRTTGSPAASPAAPRCRPAARRTTARVQMSISIVRLALVTSVTWTPPSGAAGEVPDQPGLHGAEEHLAALRPLPQARGGVEHPADPRAGEVGGQRQPARGRRTGRARRPVAAASSSTSASVRVSCQLTARPIGTPVRAVPQRRWSPAGWRCRSRPPARRRRRPGRAPAGPAARTFRQISIGSCSTQPGCG